MKITPFIEKTNKNIIKTTTRFKNAYNIGYNNAQKYSKQHNQTKIQQAFNLSKGVSKEIIKTTTLDDLPYIAGAIGFVTPIPLASPIMLGIGKILQIIIKRLHKP